MYKVFVNDKPIIVTDSLQKDKKYPVYFFDEVHIDEIIYKLRKENINGVYLFSTDVNNAWQKFKTNFKVIQAAGGLVFNEKKEILFIYRGRKWDLPKGRIEKGEKIEVTAIREVEEECGITNLIIDKFLTITYHIFYQNGEIRLKETYWFLMNTTYKGVLTPQLEEGITKAIFKNEKETEKALQKTYANILLVHEAYHNF